MSSKSEAIEARTQQIHYILGGETDQSHRFLLYLARFLDLYAMARGRLTRESARIQKSHLRKASTYLTKASEHLRALGLSGLDLLFRVMEDDGVDDPILEQAENEESIRAMASRTRHASVLPMKMGSKGNLPERMLLFRVGLACRSLKLLEPRTGPTSRFHRLSLIILQLAGCAYEDPRPLIKAAVEMVNETASI